jgi:hypothetical protein
MRIPTPTQVEAVGWLLVCGSLAATIAIEVDWGRDWQLHLDPMAVAAAEFSGPVLSSAFSLPSADTLPETSMRPVFVITRRPAPIPPPVEPPKPTMNRGQFILTGVSITPEGRFAFLVEKSANKARVVELGKSINGIAVSEILPDRIVMTQFDDSEVLLLVPAKGVPPPAAAPADAGREPGPPGALPRPRAMPSSSPRM